MSETKPALFSRSDIAKRLNQKLSIIDYAIRTRQIQPALRLSSGNVYDESGVQQIALAVSDMANAPQGPKRPGIDPPVGVRQA